MLRLYRGVCNIYEAIQILLNHTIGGQTCFDPGETKIKLLDGASPEQGKTRFIDLDPETVDAYIKEQSGSAGEGMPHIFCSTQLKPIIEYSSARCVAEGFGQLGTLEVNVNEEFVRKSKIGPEMSVFCVSNANVHRIYFCLSSLVLKNKLQKKQFVEIFKENGIILENGEYLNWNETM